MIYGIGVDIVDVARIERSLERHGDSFAKRIFTERECAYCDRHQQTARFRAYAARFAAKEAVSKALKVGIGPRFDWVDVEIVRKESGEPVVVLHGRAKDFVAALEIRKIHVSLSHADELAIAYAVAE